MHIYKVQSPSYSYFGRLRPQAASRRNPAHFTRDLRPAPAVGLGWPRRRPAAVDRRLLLERHLQRQLGRRRALAVLEVGERAGRRQQRDAEHQAQAAIAAELAQLLPQVLFVLVRSLRRGALRRRRLARVHLGGARRRSCRLEPVVLGGRPAVGEPAEGRRVQRSLDFSGANRRVHLAIASGSQPTSTGNLTFLHFNLSKKMC